MTFLVLLALTIGACGGEGSDEGSGLVPSSDIPALVDTAGMTKAQLEAKVEEIQKLFDSKREEMDAVVASGSVMEQAQASTDMTALGGQIQVYETALDALDD